MCVGTVARKKIDVSCQVSMFERIITSTLQVGFSFEAKYLSTEWESGIMIGWLVEHHIIRSSSLKAQALNAWITSRSHPAPIPKVCSSWFPASANFFAWTVILHRNGFNSKKLGKIEGMAFEPLKPSFVFWCFVRPQGPRDRARVGPRLTGDDLDWDIIWLKY